MRPHAHIALSCAICSCVCLSSVLAHAQDDATDEEFQALLDAGKERYGEGDFAGALELFEQAYAVDPRPKLLFNMGLVCERLGELEKAVAYYEEFVGAGGDIPLELRARGQERLQVLRPIVEDGRKQAAKKDAAGDGVEDPIDPKDPREPKEPVEDPAGDGGPGMGAVVALAAGGAAGLAGAAMLLTLPEEMAFVDEPTADGRRDARSARQLQQGAGYALVGVGGALLVTGVILVVTGGEPDSATQGATLAPAVGPDGVGATLRLRF
jgi:hypothetical protein